MLGWPRWRRASAHLAESYACLPIAHGDGEIACPRSRSDALIERSPQRRQHVAHDYTVYDASRGQRPTGSTQKCSTRSPVEIL